MVSGMSFGSGKKFSFWFFSDVLGFESMIGSKKKEKKRCFRASTQQKSSDF